MREVLRLCGLPQPTGGKIRSLLNPNDRTPSLHIYDDHWYDFSTGQGGDQIDFVMMALGYNHREAVEFLTRGVPTTRSLRNRFANDMPFEPADYTSKWETRSAADPHAELEWAALVPEKWPYLHLGDVLACGAAIVGEDLWIPHWVPDRGKWYVRGIKVRHLPEASKSAVSGSTFTVGLYRPQVERQQNQGRKPHAVVCEGESDSWVLAKMWKDRAVDVYALPSGAATLKDRFIDELYGYTSVGVAFDNDEVGTAATDWFMERLMVKMPEWHTLKQVYPIDVPGGRVAEAAAAGWSI
ncbi:MAG TPA: hypothetical protein VF377_08770 [Acidimicrobiia bacterium]